MRESKQIYVSQSHYVFDFSGTPLIYVWGPPGVGMDLDAVLMIETATYAQRAMYPVRHVAITNAAQGIQTMPSAAVRRELAAMLKRLDDHNANSLAAGLIITPSRVARGIMTAVDWINKPVAPRFYPETVGEAADQAEAVLQEIGAVYGPHTSKTFERVRGGIGYEDHLASLA